jgi:hypothetical protein
MGEGLHTFISRHYEREIIERDGGVGRGRKPACQRRVSYIFVAKPAETNSSARPTVDGITMIYLTAIMLTHSGSSAVNIYTQTTHRTKPWALVAPSPLCNSILVEIKCINIRRKTTVFSNC